MWSYVELQGLNLTNAKLKYPLFLLCCRLTLVITNISASIVKTIQVLLGICNCLQEGYD